MEKIQGKSWFDKSNGEWTGTPTIYTDFRCTIEEWNRLGNGRKNFMYQVRSKVAELYGGNEFYNESEQPIKGMRLRKFSLSRDCDSADPYSRSESSEYLIERSVELVTGVRPKSTYFSYKGVIVFIALEFTGKKTPNVVCVCDDRDSCTSTNGTLIFVLKSVYDTLEMKTHNGIGERYLNSDYDIIFFDDKYNGELRGMFTGYGYPHIAEKSQRHIGRCSISYNRMIDDLRFKSASEIYDENLKDQRWREKRMRIIKRDNYTCQICKKRCVDYDLHVHHETYEGMTDNQPWTVPDDALITLCKSCHNKIHFLAHNLRHGFNANFLGKLLKLYQQ